MDDDFNTPEALAALQGVARELNQAKASGTRSRRGLGGDAARHGSHARRVASRPDNYLKRSVGDQMMSDADVEALLAARRARVPQRISPNRIGCASN